MILRGYRKDLLSKVLLSIGLVVYFFICGCITTFYGVYKKDIQCNNLIRQTMGLYERKEYSEAIKVAEEGLRFAEKNYKPKDIKRATFLHYLSLLYEAQGQYSKAEELCRELIPMYESQGPVWQISGECLLASIYTKQEKYSQAETLYKQVAEKAKGIFGPRHPSTAIYLASLATFYDSRSKTAEAKSFYNQAFAILDSVPFRSYPHLVYTLEDIAAFYRKTGEVSKAKELEERIKILKEEPEYCGQTYFPSSWRK